ncbi:FAD-dependent oxidoreductase [Bacillota bacterium LX-D]|nr:FAD-dependent oxidoreductase [Bacillota bacterium LX-D]
MNQKILIVGGVAGGASAAARLRRLNEDAEIILFEKGEYISFANCGLPYHVSKVISQRQQLLVQTVESMKNRFNIDIRVKNEVLKINRQNKEVTVLNHLTGETYTENYNILLLSPGASPIHPNLPGIEHPNIFSLRNMTDMDNIISAVEQSTKGEAVIIGGGFIGIEMAENLHQLGFKISLVDLADQLMLNLDREMAAIIHNQVRQKGISLYLKNSVTEFKQKGDFITVVLQNGEKINANIVILAIGINPSTQLAKEAGLELGMKGTIKVDSCFRTSDPDIYAVGDAIETVDFLTGKPAWLPLAGPANRQGRLVADIIFGHKTTYTGVQGTSIAKIFDLNVASTGKNERSLQNEGTKYFASFTHTNSHAGYYPGSTPLTIKLLFAENGKILGAQVIGRNGVDKRIDVLATALRLGATVQDLSSLELAYAPPFSSAKDPVNIAGYVAGNILQGDLNIIHWNQLNSLDPASSVILDVREKAELEMGYIPGAVNIPLGQLRKRIAELPKNKEIIIYCQVGLRGYIASRILMQKGFSKVKNLSGGFKTWQSIATDLNYQIAYPNHKEKKTENLAEKQVAASQNLIKANRYQLDACGLQCPGPIIQVSKKMENLAEGDILEVLVTDPGFSSDIQAWCDRTGHVLLSSTQAGNKFSVQIQKQSRTVAQSNNNAIELPEDKTIVVFSGDLDKAIASFIIANGAVSMGRKVTMFFTFCGLNILRKPQKVKACKSLLDKMFGMMMPRGSKRLGLSKMNMLGIGPKMIRYVMNNKNIESLESLIGMAKLAGIRLVACQMSMDVMGITKEELIEGIEIGGVATYLAAAETSNVNLFI